MDNVTPIHGKDGPMLRTLPHNIEAEKSLLGGIFIEAGTSIIEAVAAFLKPEHFSYEPHGLIFQAILDLTGRGDIADPVTLRRFFETNDALADIGGPAYLADLAASAVTAINAKEYGRLVYDLWRRRELISSCTETADLAYGAEQETDAILEQHEAALATVLDADAGKGGLVAVAEIIGPTIHEIERAASAATTVGLSTGINDLDRFLGGLMPSDLIVVTGAMKPGSMPTRK
ncbi:MAG: hypothetical protein IIC55_10055 [Proteobacteria bacterium]|nr:hypothetical protein [Pseudomonadota bacterium]